MSPLPALSPLLFIVILATTFAGCLSYGDAETQSLTPLLEGASVSYRLEVGGEIQAMQEYAIGSVTDYDGATSIGCTGVPYKRAVVPKNEEDHDFGEGEWEHFLCLQPGVRSITSTMEEHLYNGHLYENVDFRGLDYHEFITLGSPILSLLDDNSYRAAHHKDPNFYVEIHVEIIERDHDKMVVRFEAHSTQVMLTTNYLGYRDATLTYTGRSPFPDRIVTTLRGENIDPETGGAITRSWYNTSLEKQQEEAGRGEIISFPSLNAVVPPPHPDAVPWAHLPPEQTDESPLRFSYAALDQHLWLTEPEYRKYMEAHPEALPVVAQYREWRTDDDSGTRFTHAIAWIDGREGLAVICSMVAYDALPDILLPTGTSCHEVNRFQNVHEFDRAAFPAAALPLEWITDEWQRLTGGEHVGGFLWTLSGAERVDINRAIDNAQFMPTNHLSVCLDDQIGRNGSTPVAYSCMDPATGVFSSLSIQQDR